MLGLPVFAAKTKKRKGKVPAEVWRKVFAETVRECAGLPAGQRRACLSQSLRAKYAQLAGKFAY